jgi:hypothetical protein
MFDTGTVLVSWSMSILVRSIFISSLSYKFEIVLKLVHALFPATKLDITKAFDTVDWAFLLQILIKLGFSPRWTTMVVGLLSTASTRVVVNCVADDLIYHRHGPLSHFLRLGDGGASPSPAEGRL